ncbi:MAG: ABC transporter permease [Propionibacteriaceae bacterium]
MKRAGLWVGIILVSAVVLMAMVATVWTPYDPGHVDPAIALRAPSAIHWLGTDHMGIDVLSRLMMGARICLLTGVIAVGIAACCGVPLGMIAGYRGGWIDDLLSRANDILFAFPALLLAILLAAAFGASTTIAMVAIGIATIPAFARVARSTTLPVAHSDFVLAARASGTTSGGILRRHILPNIIPTIAVQASVSFALAILAEAGLSYLGVGTPPTTPTWGRMLFDARNYLWANPELSLWPGLAIALAVLGFNLLGEGLRDILDPRLKEVR